MASEKQILANQRNAALSTGPRTAEGKARSSRNALKTGAFAESVVLPDEDAQEFHRLQAALRNEWLPLGVTEMNLVDRLAVLLWKQRRLYRGETGLYQMYRQCPEGVGGVATALVQDGLATEAFTRLSRLDTALERSIGITLGRLQQLKKDRGQRDGLAAPPPAAPSPGPAP